MTVVDHYGDEKLLARAMSLCSDAQEDSDGLVIGEPTEAALVSYAISLGLHKGELKSDSPRIGEAPFDSGRKMMSTVHKTSDGIIQYTKGAPDVVVDLCTHAFIDGKIVPMTDGIRATIASENKRMADKALRVLAAAMRKYDSAPDDFSPEALEHDLIFIGLTGMIDPVRPEVKAAIEECRGAGVQTIEMNFLPDVLVPCEECHGKRYNRETLEVRFRGKSIADILDMTINMAVEFFENIPSILSKVKVLQDVGLGYIKLGQSSTTLSGGESQRVKLATELSKRDTGKTLYILDEPTTGLHFEDIRVLMNVLNKLVDKGNTVIVIEHNLDVIKMADYIIDMGPEGGKGGGELLSCGTPEEVAKIKKGYTPKFLREELNIK